MFIKITLWLWQRYCMLLEVKSILERINFNLHICTLVARLSDIPCSTTLKRQAPESFKVATNYQIPMSCASKSFSNTSSVQDKKEQIPKVWEKNINQHQAWTTHGHGLISTALNEFMRHNQKGFPRVVNIHKWQFLNRSHPNKWSMIATLSLSI